MAAVDPSAASHGTTGSLTPADTVARSPMTAASSGRSRCPAAGHLPAPRLLPSPPATSQRTGFFPCRRPPSRARLLPSPPATSRRPGFFPRRRPPSRAPPSCPAAGRLPAPRLLAPPPAASPPPGFLPRHRPPPSTPSSCPAAGHLPALRPTARSGCHVPAAPTATAPGPHLHLTPATPTMRSQPQRHRPLHYVVPSPRHRRLCHTAPPWPALLQPAATLPSSSATIRPRSSKFRNCSALQFVRISKFTLH
ncbi:vegetative cell wall protein gp1-like [Triticum dicoccoides]|uniref:vegetative cell wall protein gp1-like n=1 Tax=Triticum dicoccoides TaxID=85692 RepID=UPI00188E6D0B|nr:vegetative cell wall protein gp1-like [Triticum dicoccoides]